MAVRDIDKMGAMAGEALQELWARIKDVFLPKSGGTVDGSLTVTGSADVGTLSTGGPVTLGIASGDAAAEIKAKLGSNLFSILRAYPGDQYGAGVYLGAGARTVIGGGEYSTSFQEQLGGDEGEEKLYLGSDNDVHVETNANTFANRKRWTFGKDGTLTAPGSVTATARDSSYLTSATAGYPAVYVKKANASGYCPVFATPTAGGGAWTLANHNNEDLLFTYLTKSRLDAKNNGYDRKVTLNPEQEGVFWSSGSEAKFVSKASVFGWSKLGTFEGEGSLTINTSGYSELLIAAVNGTDYGGSVIIPVAQLTSSQVQYFLGGGPSSSGGQMARCLVSKTKLSGKTLWKDNTWVASISYTAYAR